MPDDEDHASLTSFFAAATAWSGSQKSPAVISSTLLAEHAAGGVEVGHRQLRAALQLLAEPSILPVMDQDISPSGPAERGGKCDNG